MNRRRAFVLSVALWLVACGDTLAPTDVVGSYTLQDVNGASLPATLRALPTGCTFNLKYASLVVANGAFSLSMSSSTGCGDGLVSTQVTESLDGAATIDGDRVIFRALDPRSASGAMVEAHGTVVASKLLVTFPAGGLSLADSSVLNFGSRQPGQ